MSTTPESVSIDERLDELQRQSEQRRGELRAIAAQLPEVQSRRALFVAASSEIRPADVGRVISRALRKLGRAPRALMRRLGGS